MLPTIDSQTESERVGKEIQWKWKQERRATVLISEEIDVQAKTVTKGKERHYIMIKAPVQEDNTLSNICAPNIGTAKQIKQILRDIKGDLIII